MNALEHDSRTSSLDGGQLFAFLLYRSDRAQLKTLEGRTKVAAEYRANARAFRDKLGWEHSRTIRAADAIERGDWASLAAIVRSVAIIMRDKAEYERRQAARKERALLRFAAALERRVAQ